MIPTQSPHTISHLPAAPRCSPAQQAEAVCQTQRPSNPLPQSLHHPSPVAWEQADAAAVACPGSMHWEAAAGGTGRRGAADVADAWGGTAVDA